MTGTNRITHISFPDMSETSYHDITTGIAEGSLALDEILMTGGLNFGELNSNKFEVQLYNIADVTGQRIVVWQVDTDNNTTIPIFNGYVDSAKKNRAGYYRDIVAYDIIYTKKNDNISQWWTEFWDTKGVNGATLQLLRTELLKYVKITAVTPPAGGYLNDDLVLNRIPAEPTLTFGALLSMICQFQVMFPNVNRQGELEFITLGSTYTDESANINTHDSEFEEFSTENIDVVWIYDLDNNIIGFGGSGSSNPYRVQGNLLIKGLKYYDTLAASIYNAVSGITYVPSNVVFIQSNLDLKLGDRISTGSGYTYIFEQEFSGPILIEHESYAKGTQYLEETSDWDSELSSIQSKLDINEVRYYIFTNDDEIVVADGEKKRITDIRFTSNTKTIVIFQAEILLSVETTNDGIDFDEEHITLTYVYNGTEMAEFQPKESYLDGDHILHLFYPFTIQEAKLYHLEVYLESSGGEVTLEAGHVKSTVYGQALAATDTWDGITDLEDTAPVFTVAVKPVITMTGINDQLEVTTHTPIRPDITQEIDPFDIVVKPVVIMVGLDDEVEFTTQPAPQS